MCDFCGIEKEDFKHLFCYCNITKRVLEELCKYISDTYNIQIEPLEPQNLLFNEISDHECDFVSLAILLYKQKIYAAKCKKKTPTSHEIIEELEFIHKLEKKQASTNKQKQRYNDKWPDILSMNETEQYIMEYIEENC